MRLFLATTALALFATAAQAQTADDAALVGELMAFHGSQAIVEVMTTHCYETTGLDPVYNEAADNWYLRNISYLDLADRVIARLGGATDEQQQEFENYAAARMMSQYNQAPDKDRFCRGLLEEINSGTRDIDQILPEILRRAQEISAS